MITSPWTSKTKGIARSLATRRRPLSKRGNGRLQSAQTALSLPGQGARCFKQAFKTRLYNQHTRHTIVERDPDVMSNIKRVIAQMGLENYPVCVSDYIHKFDLQETLDFAYLDLCAALNPRVAYWISNTLAHRFFEGSSLVITLNRNWRRSNYMRFTTAMFRNSNVADDLLADVESLTEDCVRVGNTNLNYRIHDDDRLWRSWREDFSIHDGPEWEFSNDTSPVYHQSSLDALASLAILLDGVSFDLDFLLEYKQSEDKKNGAKRSMNMVTIGLSNLGCGDYANSHPQKLLTRLDGFFKCQAARLQRRE